MSSSLKSGCSSIGFFMPSEETTSDILLHCGMAVKVWKCLLYLVLIG